MVNWIFLFVILTSYVSISNAETFVTSNDNYHLLNQNVPVEKDCPIVTDKMEDRRKDKYHMRIMQYNVEWLFTEYYPPADCPGKGCPWGNSTAAQTHVEYVSQVINKINPDILNLCEIQGCEELNELINYLDNKNEYKHYVIQGDDTSTGQNVGLITKLDPSSGKLSRINNRGSYPLKNSKCGYTGQGGTTEVSKHYFTEFKFGGMDVVFIGAHLLAMPTDPERCAKREAQASILRSLIESYHVIGHEIIVYGDFNDYDKEILDLNNHEPISRVLDIIKYGFKNDNNENLEITPVHLISSEEKVKKEDRYSLWWDENGDGKVESSEYAMIDYILFSPSIYNMIKDVVVYHGYDEGLDIFDSDHYPIFVDLVLNNA